MSRTPAHRIPRKGPPWRRGTRRPLADKNTLGGKASRALGWSFFSTALGKLGLMGFGILLARLLGPHQFGTAAVAFVALLAVLSFNELGVSLAIVRWPGEPSEIAPTVATISVVSSLLLYVGLFLGAPAFAGAMGAPAAASVIRVLDLSVLTSGFTSVPAALLERHFRQDRKMIADQVHGWLAAALSVGLAWAGFGAMSIAIGSVVGAVAGGTVIMISAPHSLRFEFDLTKARKLMRFGLPLAGSSLVVFLVANVDNLVAGHMLGATALGFYVLAWNLASWPVTMFSQPVRAVAPALFSRLQHDPAAMRTSFVSAGALLGSVTLPVCLLISGSAVPLISLVYGTRWAPAAQALMWLALLGALRVLFELAYDYFVVLARSRVVFMVQVAWLLALIPALITGARLDGIRGVAVAGVVVAAFVVLPSYLIELSKVGIRVRALAARLWLPLLAAAGVGAVAWASAKVIPNDLAACAVGGVSALSAIGLLGLRMRPVLAEMRPVLAAKGGLEPTSAHESPPVGGDGSADPAPEAGRPRVSADPAAQAAGLNQLLAIAAAAPPWRDMTGPLSAYREASRVTSIHKDVVPASNDPASPGCPTAGSPDDARAMDSPIPSPESVEPGVPDQQIRAHLSRAGGDEDIRVRLGRAP